MANEKDKIRSRAILAAKMDCSVHDLKERIFKEFDSVDTSIEGFERLIMKYTDTKYEHAIRYNVLPDDTPAALMVEIIQEYVAILKTRQKSGNQTFIEMAMNDPGLLGELIEASENGDFKRVEELVKKHPEILNKFIESIDDDGNKILKETLNNGIGSPGETTRVLSGEFKKIRQSVNRKEACREVLTNRAMTYSRMGMEVINQDYLERILTKADGEFPIVIFADIYATNNYPPYDRVELVLENFDILIEVIVENYNSIVDSNDKAQWVEGLKFKIEEIVNEELGRNVFEVKRGNFYNHVWSFAKSFPEKDSEVWRKDQFGAWIRKDDYNKSNAYGWRIIAVQEYGLYLPLHFLNSERDENEEFICRVRSNENGNLHLNKS